MNYTPLSKLFYSNSDEYKEIYNLRFNSCGTIHFDFKINDNDAFLVLNSSIIQKTIDIYKKDKQVFKLCKDLPGVAINHFAKRCLIDEIVITNNIEGVHSSRKEITTVLSDIEENNGKIKRFDGLVRKYMMLQDKETMSFQSCQDIRNLYDELVYSEIKEDDPDNLPDGKLFRKDSTSVLSATQKEIHRGVNPESKIIKCMNDALKMLNDDSIEKLYRVAVFHYIFGYIHPFYDGNGRTSRFISSCLLSQELEPLIGYRLSYTIKQNINEYYAAFNTCNDKRSLGDVTPFVIMFLKILDISITQLIEALLKREKLLEKYHFVIPKLKNGTDEKYQKIYSLLIQASLFSEDGISTQELLFNLGIKSSATLLTRLNNIEPDIIIKKRIGTSFHYALNLELIDNILDESK